MSLARDYGQWKTIRDWNSADENGSPIPWYTYPTTEYLTHLDLSRFQVFEYGSGNSTLWWASRVKQVISVEDDEAWHAKIKEALESSFEHANYHLQKEKDRYVAMATKGSDIFIVDGKYRRECAEHVVNLCGGGVMLIFDNSDWYPKTIDFIRRNLRWMQIDFHGFGPINNYTWTTSIFVNPERHHELLYNKALNSKCGIAQMADADF